jgi:hypothetical protein
MRILRSLALRFTALAANALAADGIVFDQAYKPGYTYHQTMTMKQEMEMDMGSVKMDRKVSTTMGMLAKVTPHENDRSKRVAIQYDSIQASVEGTDRSLASTPRRPTRRTRAAPGLRQRLWAGVQSDLRRSQNVTDVEQLDATVQNLAAAIPRARRCISSFQQGRGEAHDAAIRAQVASRQASEQRRLMAFLAGARSAGARQTLDPRFYTYVGDVVRDGKKLAQVKAAAEVTMDTTPAGANDEAAQRLQQMQLKIEEGKMEGMLYYDTEINFTREIEVGHKITLTGKIPDGSGKLLRLPMKQSITMLLDKFEKTK